MFRHFSKQLVIAFVAAAVVVGTAFLMWRLTIYETPTCFDDLQNQDEVGIDCGGACEPCTALPQDIRLNMLEWVSGEDGTIDALMTLENPNVQWGVRTLPFTIFFEDENGGRIGEERDGTAFLLPLETRGVVSQAIPGPQGPLRPRVSFEEPVWVEVPDRVRDDGLVVLDTTFTRLTEGPDVAEVRGLIRNDSPFTYDRIEIHVVIRDKAEALAGLRWTEMRTLATGERREFRVAWRTGFSLIGDPRVEVLVATNVFENENFIRTHGTVERFQEIKEELRFPGSL